MTAANGVRTVGRSLSIFSDCAQLRRSVLLVVLPVTSVAGNPNHDIASVMSSYVPGDMSPGRLWGCRCIPLPLVTVKRHQGIGDRTVPTCMYCEQPTDETIMTRNGNRVPACDDPDRCNDNSRAYAARMADASVALFWSQLITRE